MGLGNQANHVVSDVVELEGRSRVDIAISTSAVQRAALPEGNYDVISTVDCWLKVAPTANDVTAAAGANAGYLLKANTMITVMTKGNLNKIGIVAGGAGTFSYHQVG